MIDHVWLGSCSFGIDPTVRRLPHRVVVGGTPTRVLRLTAAGARLMSTLLVTGRAPADLSAAGGALIDRMVRAGMLHPQPPAAASPREVAVVIPGHDHSAHVAGAIAAGLEVGPVTVVDDGSTDGTGDQARRAGATVVRLHANVGPAAARNRGVAATGGEFIVFVDADCVPQPGTLARLLGHLVDPAVGAVAPRVVGAAAPGRQILRRYEQTRSPIDMGPLSGPVRPDARVSFVPTATIAVRRSAFDEVGGFDEGLRFGEDVDFVWRLHQAGWEVRYDSRVLAGHHHRRRPAAIARRRWLYGTSAGPLAERHPAALAAVRASPWTLASWLALLLGRWWLAAGLAGWSWLGLHRALRHLPGGGGLSGRLVATGLLGAARPLAAALTRTWAPLPLAVAA
ncbi:MAG: mycofactocin biosynthesis glycosyltransferase MftF, partial [Acidimicrobiia bacterium]|nr:mycofactocin biosynthesis glycosyltransferase MftF [Acidimicrobiia bacterium]